MLAGTIVASNYLAMAQLLARSYLAAHPNGAFKILLVDDREVDTASGPDHGVELVRLTDLDLSEHDIALMRSVYDVTELSTAVKPAFLRHLLRSAEIACYIDPDVYVYRGFDDLVVEPAQEHGLVFTPHVLQPIPRDGRTPTEREIMQSGIMNLGFVAVGRRAHRMLDWWQERLLVDAVSAVETNLFTDQRWIDWVPALFDHHVCRDPGMNVAWWNIHERSLDETADGVVANGAPLRFVHFSGYSPADPTRLSKHQAQPTRFGFTADSVIGGLAAEYGRSLVAAGHLDRIGTSYQYDATADGVVLTRAVRRTIRLALLGGAHAGSEVESLRDDVPLAFGRRAASLRSWLLDVDPAVPGLPRVAVALWHIRADLQTEFPTLAGHNIDRFRFWLAHDPGAEVALPGLVSVTPPPPPDAPPPLRRMIGRIRRAGAVDGRL